MKILIHAISTKMGGARRHLNNMVKSLADANTDHQFILLVNDEYDTSVFDEKIDTITFPTTYSSGVKRVILDNWHINKIIEERDIDILISFANFGPVKAKCKHILFEMNALFFCENIRNLYNKKQLLDFAVKRFLIKLSTIRADLTVTPSESLKHQIVKSLHVPEKKIEVLYHAIEHDFCEIEEPEVDVVIFRQNTEGLYGGVEWTNPPAQVREALETHPKMKR